MFPLRKKSIMGTQRNGVASKFHSAHCHRVCDISGMRSGTLGHFTVFKTLGPLLYIRSNGSVAFKLLRDCLSRDEE